MTDSAPPFDHKAFARDCYLAWPDTVYHANGQRFAARARCTSCRCFTIPVRMHCKHPDSDCSIKAPGKYPCPVCGQADQYIFVWIAARARHHSQSMESLRERGYVSKDYGPLRAPWQSELPEPSMRDMVVFDGGDSGASAVDATALLVRIGDARKVNVPDDYHGYPSDAKAGADKENLQECDHCRLPH